VTSDLPDDDDQLLAVLKSALDAQESVPSSFVTTAKASFVWRTIDAELAALTYDSSHDLLAGSASRAEPAALRCLTFGTSRLTIELEIIQDVLHGQVIPSTAGQVEIRHADGATTPVPINDVGYFTYSPVPSGTFRLHCRTADGTAVLTDWITL